MEIHKKQKLTYFLYARKSSESEDRQVQSIDNQTDRLVELANNLSITIKQVFTEAKTAKKPNNRPVFDDMMKKIEAGEADGILCWQINRLSRNPIDSARIQWLLQQGILKSIQTFDREYRPEDNVLLFNVESGMANQYVLDLSKTVKRGNLHKVKNGWRPGVAATGYLNELENHTTISDPERFPLIRKAWDLMLTGNYTAPQVLRKLNDEWGFRTKQRKKMGGKPLSMSGMYAIFSSLYYAGIIVYDGKEYPGKHEKMITLEEYDRVQEIMGRAGKPRSKRHCFAFTGMMKCDECGCSITAEKKTKLIKATGMYRTYTYYHCTRRKRSVNCSQTKFTESENLEEQIIGKIKKLSIIPEFYDWALEALKESKDESQGDIVKIYEMQQRSLSQTEQELENLVQMRYKELIDDAQFVKQRDTLQEQIRAIKKEVEGNANQVADWKELTEQAFNFAHYAEGHFKKGDYEEKKKVFSGLGSDLKIRDQKLHISAYKWLVPIIEGYLPLETQYLALEPANNGSVETKTEALTSVIALWQAR